MAKSIMIQGTASSVGKSIITAGLCRVFKNDGYNVAPFKSQNMALNSYITKNGDEMGRAQVVQAEAAGIPPNVLMNPILLKPTSDRKSQVIINGKVYKNMDAKDYQEFKSNLIEIVSTAYKELSKKHDIIVLEGAGSPAEINLKNNDIVNMGMAKISDSPVILVADIDRGGVFASIFGTVMLLEDYERARIKGIIINKFRGDIEILKPGILQIESLTNIPVLGVMPYFKLKIEDEDSLSEKFMFNDSCNQFDIDIVVIKLPYISNFTDFNALENINGVRIRYCESSGEVGEPDLIIIPGSKSTINDLVFLRNSGLEKQILRLSREGVPIFGVCAGMQMLGNSIKDPFATESEIQEINGMGLLDIDTVFEKTKTTKQVCAKVKYSGNLMVNKTIQTSLKKEVEGYEIHMGSTEYNCGVVEFINRNDGETIGVHNVLGSVYGTYLHGIFDNNEFTDVLITNLKHKKGKTTKNSEFDFKQFKETQYQELDRLMRENINIDEVYNIVGMK